MFDNGIGIFPRGDDHNYNVALLDGASHDKCRWKDQRSNNQNEHRKLLHENRLPQDGDTVQALMLIEYPAVSKMVREPEIPSRARRQGA